MDLRHSKKTSSFDDLNLPHSTWPMKRAQRFSATKRSKTTVAKDQWADYSCPPSAHITRTPILERVLHPKSCPKSRQPENYNTSARESGKASILCTSSRAEKPVGFAPDSMLFDAWEPLQQGRAWRPSVCKLLASILNMRLFKLGFTGWFDDAVLKNDVCEASVIQWIWMLGKATRMNVATRII